MAEIASDVGKRARAARFDICEDKICAVSTTPHLVIGIHEVPLHRDNAVAISYAWGQFDRQRRSIGHFSDGREVSMELGGEWGLQDVVERLAELSEKKPLWIDQLCMPQKEEQVAKALADIPSIFCTLDVVIFMPGNPCGCIPEMLDEFSKIPTGPNYYTQIQECVSRRKECLGWGVSSWVRRLWPRQELMFSQRIRCVWASKEKRKCATQDGFDEPQDVPAFANRMILMHLRQSPLDKEYTLAYARKAAMDYMNQAEQVMVGDYAHYVYRSKRDFRVEESFFRFLLGAEVRNGGQIRGMPEIVPFIFRLQAEMGARRDNNRVRREATRARDYVISIWTACPGYEIPDDFQSMRFSDLLQDAVNQLQKKHHRALATTAPRGLFDAPCLGSALWNPADYLSAVTPASDVDVYRTLANEGWGFDAYHTHMVPICILNTEQPALSMQAFDYCALIEMWEAELESDDSYSEVSYGAEITPRLVELLHAAMSNWGEQRRQALQGAFRFDCFQQWSTQPLTIETLKKDTVNQRRLRRYQSVQRYLDFFLDHGFNDSILDAYHQHLEPYINPFHLGEVHDAIYIIVAASLELDVEYCEKKGVELIFHPGDRNKVKPRVGFSSRGIGVGAKSDKGDCITVSMAGPKYPSGSLLYEAFPLPQGYKGSDVDEVSDVDEGFEIDEGPHIDEIVDVDNISTSDEGSGVEEVSEAGEGSELDEGSVSDEDEDLLPYFVFAVWVPTESITSDEYGAQARPPKRWKKGQKQGALV